MQDNFNTIRSRVEIFHSMHDSINADNIIISPDSLPASEASTCRRERSDRRQVLRPAFLTTCLEKEKPKKRKRSIETRNSTNVL